MARAACVAQDLCNVAVAQAGGAFLGQLGCLLQGGALPIVPIVLSTDSWSMTAQIPTQHTS